MKKVVSIILCAVMLLGLVACGGAAETPAQTEEPAAPAAEPAPAETPAAPAEEPAPVEEPAAPVEGTTIGLKANECDHFNRDPFKIAYIVTVWTSINASISAQFEQLGKIMNYEYAVVDAENNSDNFLNYLDVYAVQGYDGFMLDFYMDLAPRIAEYCSELGVDWIVAVNPCMDDAGNMLWPGVTFDPFIAGGQMGDWLYENYQTYFGDVDQKEIGLMTMATTEMIDLHRRALGAAESFEKNFADVYESNYYFADVTGKTFSSETAFDEASAIMSAHPELKYWLVATMADIHAIGVARACENLGKNDTSLVTCVGADAVITEWDGGYDGCLKAALHLPSILYAEPIICGLMAMLEGRATAEELWPEWKAEGQSYANLQLTYDVYTRDNYKEGLASADSILAGYLAELGQ